MFNWDDLRFFLAVARKRRLVSAAQALKVDHTTVSRRLRALEETLGARLFERSPRGYRLTEAGRTLMPTAEAMEAASFRLYKALSGKDAQLAGPVRFAATEAFGGHVITPLLAEFARRHPGIEIEMIATTPPLNLTKREADFAIMLAPPPSGRLVAWKLTDYKLQLYGAPDYLAAHPPITTPDDLGGHRFVWYIEDLLPVPQLHFLETMIREPHVSYRSTSLFAQWSAVRAGMGLSLLPRFLAEDDAGLTLILGEEIEVVREFWLVVHEDLRQVARVDAVCRFLTRRIRALQPRLMGETARPEVARQDKIR